MKIFEKIEDFGVSLYIEPQKLTGHNFALAAGYGLPLVSDSRQKFLSLEGLL